MTSQQPPAWTRLRNGLTVVAEPYGYPRHYPTLFHAERACAELSSIDPKAHPWRGTGGYVFYVVLTTVGTMHATQINPFSD